MGGGIALNARCPHLKIEIWGTRFCGSCAHGERLRVVVERTVARLGWAGAFGLCPMPTYDDEAVMNGAPDF
jgi:hypothetical protein